jgi:hypothetical protein
MMAPGVSRTGKRLMHRLALQKTEPNREIVDGETVSLREETRGDTM